MQRATKLLLLFLFIPADLRAQELETGRLMESEFKMTFPSVYFKHNSVEYAPMPYTADSCFRHLASHFDATVNSLVIWRDSAETEDLAGKRMKRLKAGLSKYMPAKKIEIYSMGKEQKISRHTIHLFSDSAKIRYLLSLNSVFDMSRSRVPAMASASESHILHPKIWCASCWKNGFHLNKRGRAFRKMARQNKDSSKNK